MPNPTGATFLNATTPAPLAGYQNALPQNDGGFPLVSASLSVPNTGGVRQLTSSYTSIAADCGLLLVFNSSNATTLTLPPVPPFEQWTTTVANIGTGTLTISPGNLLLDGDSSVVAVEVPQFCGVMIATDGTNYFSARGIATGGGTSIYEGAVNPASNLGKTGDFYFELNDDNDCGGSTSTSTGSSSGGSAAAESFTFVQSSPATTWVIVHNLNTFPSVTVTDSSGSYVVGTQHYDSVNQVTLTFSAAFSGTAVLI